MRGSVDTHALCSSVSFLAIMALRVKNGHHVETRGTFVSTNVTCPLCFYLRLMLWGWQFSFNYSLTSISFVSWAFIILFSSQSSTNYVVVTVRGGWASPTGQRPQNSKRDLFVFAYCFSMEWICYKSHKMDLFKIIWRPLIFTGSVYEKRWKNTVPYLYRMYQDPLTVYF